MSVRPLPSQLSNPGPGLLSTLGDQTGIVAAQCSRIPTRSLSLALAKESSMRASLLSVLGTFTIILTLMLSSPASAQDETWLDGDLASWNTPGMAIPSAPTIEGNTDPRCVERERPAETAEDDALIAEGWHLFLPYQRGWGVTLISGLASYDGMCRPLGYQSFVFVDGVLPAPFRRSR